MGVKPLKDKVRLVTGDHQCKEFFNIAFKRSDFKNFKYFRFWFKLFLHEINANSCSYNKGRLSNVYILYS